MANSLLEKLQRMVTIQGIAGQEQEIVSFLIGELEGTVDLLEVDSLGNVMAMKQGKRPGPRFLVAAHSDQIGAVIRYIDPRGFVYFEKVGGVLDSLLLGRKVLVGNVPGVVGVKPGHYQTEKEKTTIVPSDDMYIDIGVDTREEAEKLGLAPGTPITYADSLTLLQDGKRFAGAAVDNRAGCSVLWQVLENIADGNFGGEFWGVFTVQEEVGLRGAGVAATRIKPDFALALDTIPCGGTPDVGEKEMPTEIGKGPVFPLVSGRQGTFSMHPKIKEILISTAQNKGIPYQCTVFNRGNNDASSMEIAGNGIPAGAITLPRRYSHSPVEMGDLRDMESTTILLESMVRDMDGYGDMTFI